MEKASLERSLISSIPTRSLKLYSDENTDPRYYNDSTLSGESGTLPDLHLVRVHLDTLDLRLLNECKFLLSSNPSMKSFHIGTSRATTKALYEDLLDFIFIHPRPSLSTLSFCIPIYDKDNKLFEHLSRNSTITTLQLSTHCMSFGQSVKPLHIPVLTSLIIDGFFSPMVNDKVFEAIQMPSITSIEFRRIQLTKGMASFVMKHSPTIVSLTIHTTTVKWPLQNVIASCVHLSKISLHLLSSAPLSLSHLSLKHLSLDGLYLDEQNGTATSTRLQNKLYCFVEQYPTPFPKLESIHFPHFRRANLIVLQSLPAALIVWRKIFRSCVEREISITDGDGNTMTSADL